MSQCPPQQARHHVRGALTLGGGEVGIDDEVEVPEPGAAVFNAN